MRNNRNIAMGTAVLVVALALTASLAVVAFTTVGVDNSRSNSLLSGNESLATAQTSQLNNFGPNNFNVIGPHRENPAGSGGVVGTITTGSEPWGIAYDNATQQVFVANANSASFSVINSSTNSVSYTFTLPPSPYAIAYDPANTYLYATDTSLSTLWVLTPGTSTYSVTTWYSLPAVGAGVAYDSGNHHIYVAIPSLNEVVALDAGTGSIVASISVNAVSPQYLAYDPANGYLYVTDRVDNAVTIIDTSTDNIVLVLGVYNEPTGIAYDPKNKYVYVANYDSESVSVIDTLTSQVLHNIPITGQKVYGVAYDLSNNYVYVTDYFNFDTNSGGNSVSIINTTTDTYAGAVTVGQSPVSVAYDPANGNMYVSNSVSNTVSVISSPSVSISVSSSTMDVGQTVSLTATPSSGTGTYPTYSWYSESPGSSTYSSIQGASGSGYSFATSAHTTTGTYRFEAAVTDSNGATSLLSNVESLTVYSDPTVSISPSGHVNYRVGQTASALTSSVTYSGTNTASVEWYSNNVNSTSGGTDTGTSSLTFTPATSTIGTTYYYSVVSDSGVASYSSSSNVVEVTIEPIPHSGPVKYFAYFEETGLPSGSTWEINVDGHNYKNNTQFIFLILPAGTNNFTVTGPSGYYATPSSATVDVNHAPYAINVVFAPAPLEGFFTGSIPVNSSLFINGIPYNTNAGQFNISLKPGSYTVNVTEPGHNPYSGNVIVNTSSSTVLRVDSLTPQQVETLSPVAVLLTVTAALSVTISAAMALIIIRIRKLKK